MLNNLTIKTRLILLVAALSIIALVIGLLGLRNLSVTHDALETVYKDRVIALGQLSEVLTLIQQNQTTLSRAASGEPAQFAAVASDVEQRIGLITSLWAQYMATELTDQEKVMAKTFADNRATFVERGIKPGLGALRAGDAAAAVALVHGPLTTTFLPVRDSMRALIKLQLEVGKTEFTASQDRYQMARAVAIALIAFSLVLGGIAAALIIRNITRAIASALQMANSVAAGNLTEKIHVDSQDELGQLLTALQRMNDGLVGIVVEVRNGTESIATAAAQIAAGNQDLSSRTEEQASSLEETASSMEELLSTVKNNAENARQANTLAGTASSVASKGGTVIGHVVETMERINDSSRKIVDIIGVIDGIAFQTNILALNAAVEAARAGEQGRGFAVVAGEVRNLAQRSAQAAKEIKSLIGSSVEQVEAGTKLVDEAGDTMQDIVRSIGRVTDIMADIAAASQEQTDGIEQINEAVIQMDQVTQQNAALVEEAAAASEAMQDQAAQMAQVVSVFQVDAALLRAPVAARASAPARPAKPAALSKPRPLSVGLKEKKASTPASADEWEEF